MTLKVLQYDSSPEEAMEERRDIYPGLLMWMSSLPKVPLVVETTFEIVPRHRRKRVKVVGGCQFVAFAACCDFP
jgi:hypothetical protein